MLARCIAGPDLWSSSSLRRPDDSRAVRGRLSFRLWKLSTDQLFVTDYLAAGTGQVRSPDSRGLSECHFEICKPPPVFGKASKRRKPALALHLSAFCRYAPKG